MCITFFCLPPLYLLVSWAWWDWPLAWLTNQRPSVLWCCWLGHMTRKIVSEMSYNVSSGTLNPTVLYETFWYSELQNSFVVIMVQKLLKSLNICKNYCKKFTATFLWMTVYIEHIVTLMRCFHFIVVAFSIQKQCHVLSDQNCAKVVSLLLCLLLRSYVCVMWMKLMLYYRRGWLLSIVWLCLKGKPEDRKPLMILFSEDAMSTVLTVCR